MPDRRAERLWARQMRLVNAPLEAIFAAKYRQLMEAMREASSSKPGQKPFDKREWSSRIAREMEPFYRLALQAGARSMLVLSPTVRQQLRRRAALVERMKQRRFGVNVAGTLARRLAQTVDTTYDALESVLEEAVADKLDPAEIADLIAQEWADILGDRTDMIATTETSVAVNSAREYVAHEVVELWRWVTARDERVRANHVIYGEADPKPVGFNYATLSGGRYTLRYPGDPECEEAGEIVNCRCMTVPEGDLELAPDELESFLEEFDMSPGDLQGGEEATPGWISNPYA
jgi:hypothetical protein